MELGQELIVRDGKFFTIGDKGAQFFHYKKNDIVFNATQTESLFKYGGIKGANPRGKMLASGTAFAEGNAFRLGSTGTGGDTEVGGGSVIKKETTTTTTTTTTSSSKSSSSSSKSSSNSSSSKSSSSSEVKEAAEEFEETIDWIEVAISRIQRAIDLLDQKAGNIYKSWSKRNSALADQISEVGNEIDLQQKAYSRYMQEANSVGLSESYASKVRDGTIDIETIKDEALKEKIDQYTEWYEKALDCEKAIEELRETEASLYAQRVENASAQYEGILGVIEHEKNMLDEYISQSEANATLVSVEYYKALAKNERENVAELKKQKDSMLAEFEDAMDSGTIDKYSESYYDMVASIDEVTLALEESNTTLIELEQTIQQLNWSVFDLIQDKISSVSSEAEFLIDLMSNKKLFDDNGQLTNEGKSTMGLHGVNYNINMVQADQAAKEAERLKKELAKDPYDTELEERYREMIALQQEHILAAEQEKDAIADLVSEGIDLELDALQELIDKKNEALDSEKSLYEYQKKVKEQTSEIASLEKQIASFSGDDSEEAKAKVQQLKVDLESAQQELEETEYEKWISDTEILLDNLYLEYETILNTRLDNIDYLLESMIAEINADAGIIGDTIRESTEAVGYTLSESMQTIWTAGEANLTGSITSSGDKITGTLTSTGDKVSNVITMYGDKFSLAQTTTNTVLGNISTNVQNMISQLNKLAKTNVKAAGTSSAANPQSSSNTTTTTTNPTTSTSSGGDGTPKVGDKVKFVSGQYYYDSEGARPLGAYYQGKEVYITKINSASWATHPYHISTGNKLGNGDLGWLKLNQLSGYASGKKNIVDNEYAWTQEDGKEFIIRPSDGAILTPVARGDSVLNASASRNIWDMANSPSDFIKKNLKLDSASIPNASNVQNSYVQNLENVTFNLPNVQNYNELLTAMQKDKNFERLILSMSVDQIAGRSSLSKGKAIR